MKRVTTQQLFDMKNTLLKDGVDCVYLSENIKASRYHMRLMGWLFRFDYFSIDQYVICYPEATLYFRDASSPPHTLYGYRARIVADHNAFRARNPDVQKFLDLIDHSRRYEYL